MALSFPVAASTGNAVVTVMGTPGSTSRKSSLPGPPAHTHARVFTQATRLNNRNNEKDEEMQHTEERITIRTT